MLGAKLVELDQKDGKTPENLREITGFGCFFLGGVGGFVRFRIASSTSKRSGILHMNDVNGQIICDILQGWWPAP